MIEDFLSNIESNDIVCYTDRSVIEPDKPGLGKCGAGVIIYSYCINNQPLIISEKVSNYSSAYHGEIAAIGIALNKCLDLCLERVKNIYILSDCQSAIQSSTNNKLSDSHQDEIYDINCNASKLVRKGITVSISWIGGHCDVQGNDLADKAAKNGAKLNQNPRNYKISLKNVKKIILDSAMSHWQKKWNYSETGSHLKEIQPNVYLGNSPRCIQSRLSQITLHQVKIGRSKLNNQDPINKNKIEEKMCTTCKVPEDTEHFFLHCNRYITQRHFLFSNIEAILHEKNIPHQDVISNL